MDADIRAAANAFDLEKIKAQDYRVSLRQATSDRAAHLATVNAFLEWVKAQYAMLPPEVDPARELRHRLALAIADKYFTTSTATSPDAVRTDAVNDAARFRAALDEAVRAVNGQ